MRIKLKFKRVDSGVVEEFELTPLSVTNPYHIGHIATMERGDKKYAWPFGSCNIFEVEGNVLCAKHIETEYLYVEYINA